MNNEKSQQDKNPREIRVYQHSDLLYWWIVWLYGFGCAATTYFGGTKLPVADKQIIIHESPWVGITYIAVLMLVLVSTYMRARGIHTLLLLFAIALLGGILQYFRAWDAMLEEVPNLRIHMNLAFYVVVSTLILTIWVLAVFVVNRFSYWFFQPGEIGRRDWLGEGAESYIAKDIELKRVSDDILVHRILGLWFLGAGTGDLEVRFTSPGGPRMYTLKNVWRVSRKEEQIRQLMRLRESS